MPRQWTTDHFLDDDSNSAGLGYMHFYILVVTASWIKNSRALLSWFLQIACLVQISGGIHTHSTTFTVQIWYHVSARATIFILPSGYFFPQISWDLAQIKHGWTFGESTKTGTCQALPISLCFHFALNLINRSIWGRLKTEYLTSHLLLHHK